MNATLRIDGVEYGLRLLEGAADCGRLPAVCDLADFCADVRSGFAPCHVLAVYNGVEDGLCRAAVRRLDENCGG